MDPRNHKSGRTDPHAMQPAERRTHRRKHLHLKADVTLPGDLTIVGHTLDISASGMSIETPFRLEPGQRCEIELNLSKLGGPAWIQVIGEVRRCEQIEPDVFTAGLQFVDMDAEVAQLLDAYVWSRVANP